MSCTYICKTSHITMSCIIVVYTQFLQFGHVPSIWYFIVWMMLCQLIPQMANYFCENIFFQMNIYRAWFINISFNLYSNITKYFIIREFKTRPFHCIVQVHLGLDRTNCRLPYLGRISFLLDSSSRFGHIHPNRSAHMWCTGDNFRGGE